jgi:biopolymer transport protein ExbD
LNRQLRKFNFSDLEDASEPTIEMNVIPLIDLLLVLLIFFMTSASFVAAGNIPVTLPVAGQQNSHAEAHALTLTKNGEVYFDKQQIPREAVVAFVKARLEEGSNSNGSNNRSIVIRADQEVTHGEVIALLDELQSGGISEVIFATSSAKK